MGLEDAEPHTEGISEGFLLDWSGILAFKNKEQTELIIYSLTEVQLDLP